VSVERAVAIAGPGGVPMFGVVHEPKNPVVPRIGVNLLNPGLKSRVAPNRLNVVLARRLARLGFYVLRFDPPGIGDSGGELPEEILPELWQNVQRGAFVEATRLANEAFAAEYGLEEIVGIGNCGGAITALLEARTDPRVRRLVLIDLPVTLRDADLGKQKQIRGARHGGKVLRGYLRRMRDPQAWLRLFTLRSNVRVIGQAMRARFVDPVREAGKKSDPQASPPAGLTPGEVLSRPFLEAMTEFHDRGGRAVFVNAGDYDNTFVFDRLFAETWLAPGRAWANRHSRTVVPGANHVYGTPEWRAILVREIEGALANPAQIRR
jgi:pimeloyl-ACP methyl ester carboxylesterase